MVERLTATEVIESRERYGRSLNDDLEREFDRIFEDALLQVFSAPQLPPLGGLLTVQAIVRAARAMNAVLGEPGLPLDIDPTMQVAPRRPLEDLVQSVLEYEGLDDDELEEVG